MQFILEVCKCHENSLVVLLIALAALVSAEDEWKPTSDPKVLRQIHEDCKKEKGVIAEQGQNIKDMDHPHEREVREYALCPVLKLGIFTVDKGYNLERLIEQVGVFVEMNDELKGLVAGCMDKNEENTSPADWAYRGQQCIMRTKVGPLANEKANKILRESENE